MKKVRLAKKLIQILSKDNLRNSGRLLTDAAAIVARCGVLLIIYAYVFKQNGGSINGVVYVTAAWSMFFYFAFSILRLRDIARSFMADVQSGNVEVLFSKPVSYLFYRFFWQIGVGINSFAVLSVLGALALFLIIGLPDSMAIGIFLPTFLLVFSGAVLLSLILYSIIGLLSFWIDDINPVFWIVDKAVMILGGSYLPVALFPDLMYKLAVYSPFGASQFLTHSVHESWRTDWPFLIGIQFGWIIILGLLMFFIFTKARKKISINGG